MQFQSFVVISVCQWPLQIFSGESAWDSLGAAVNGFNNAMASRNEKDRTKQIQDKCQTILNQLLKDEDNKYCVDCDAKGVLKFGFFLSVFRPWFIICIILILSSGYLLLLSESYLSVNDHGALARYKRTKPWDLFSYAFFSETKYYEYRFHII